MTGKNFELSPKVRAFFANKRGLILIMIAAYSIFVLTKLITGHFDFSRFIVAGDTFFTESSLEYPIHVIPHSGGYDGQFYYRLALNPATHERVQYGISFDYAEVRAQRILYPATVWAVSLGNGYLVPYAMVLVNLMSIGIIAWVAMLLAEVFGVPRQFGLLLPFYPGFVLTMARDTAEIYASLFAICAVYAAVKRKHAFAALFGIAAVLVREITLIYLAGFAIAMLIDSLKNRKTDLSFLIYLAVPVALIIWNIILWRQWGSFPLNRLSSDDFVFPPLVDFLRQVGTDLRDIATGQHILRYAYNIVSLIAVPAFVILILRQVFSRVPAEPGLKLSWAFYFVLLTVFSVAIWREPYGYIRILCDAYLLGCLIMMSARNLCGLQKLARYIGCLWVLTCAYTF